MKKVLITGGNGFLSSRIKNHYDPLYDILSLPHKKLDVTNENSINKVFEEFNPDYVVHAAAISKTDECENNPKNAFNVNVQGSINIAKSCNQHNSKMIFLSTEQIYNGNTEPGPYSEDCTALPNTIYGETKLQSENEIIKYTEPIILRLTWLYGLPERGLKTNQNILWSTISSILNAESQDVPVYEFRGMTYVYDLVEKFKFLMNLPSGTYNTGSENNLNRYAIVKLILEELGVYDNYSHLFKADYNRYKDNPRDIRINNGKLKNLGIEFDSTEVSLKKSLIDYNLLS